MLVIVSDSSAVDRAPGEELHLVIFQPQEGQHQFKRHLAGKKEAS